MFTLPELPYAYDALEPAIDAQTMEIHHGKHHAGYTSKLNSALEAAGQSDLSDSLTLEAMLRDVSQLPDAQRQAIINNGGGYHNHSLFRESLCPVEDSFVDDAPTLTVALEAEFGSFDAMIEQLNDAAGSRFGSGRGWLVVDAAGELKVISTPNQDSPLMQGLTPIFGVDVWEHAYYLRYQNRRPDYLGAIWTIVNWKVLEERYLAVKNG